MIAHAFDHCSDTRIPNSEPLTGYATEVTFASNTTIKDSIADDNILLRFDGRDFGGVNHKSAAGQPLTNVIVRVSF